MIGHAQLLEAGLGSRAVQSWLARRRLFPVHRGVYKLGPSPLTQRGELFAAALACGPSSLISHRSAGALWGLMRWTSLVQVVVPGSGGRAQPGIAIHRSRHLLATDQARRDGIPVTSVARTLVDLAGVLDEEELRRAVEEADRLGLLRIGQMTAACARSNGRRGIGALRSILGCYTAPPATLSPLEDRLLDFCREHGIPLPEMNVTLAGWKVDAHWPTARLVVELDSWEFHAGRGQFDRDRRKGFELQDAGFVFVRLSAPQLEGGQGEATAAALLRHLAVLN